VPESAEAGGAPAQARAVDALEANPAFTTVGATARGMLWHFEALKEKELQGRPGPAETSVGLAVLIGQVIVFGLALILAIPTGRRRRPTAHSDELADTFEEDDSV
jgi:hypothetical protein